MYRLPGQRCCGPGNDIRKEICNEEKMKPKNYQPEDKSIDTETKKPLGSFHQECEGETYAKTAIYAKTEC
jgi:hypothetical protein